MLARQTHMTSLALIRRKRVLDSDGRVLVKPGDRPDPAGLIARANGPTRHQLVDVAGMLGEERSQFPNRLIQRQVGEQVEIGDILARQGNLLRKIVRTPVEGTIVAIGGGQVMIETRTEGPGVVAGFPGIVKEILPDRGAVLETSGALLQGMWGNGKLGQGPLILRGALPDEPFTVSQRESDLKDCVLVSGAGTDRQSLLYAERLGIAGLVLGSLSSSLLDLAEHVPFPIILIDGFGKNGMNVVAYRIFQSLIQQNCYLLADSWDKSTGRRPECIIPLLADGVRTPELYEFLPGQYVRLNCQPYIGQTGLLNEILPAWEMAPFGRQTPLGTVKLENQQIIQVPLANLDILE